MRLATAALALGLAVSLTACARPGDTPSGTPAATSEVTFLASLAPAPPRRAVPRPLALAPGTATVGCDGRRIPPPGPPGSPPSRIRPAGPPKPPGSAPPEIRPARPPKPPRSAPSEIRPVGPPTPSGSAPSRTRPTSGPEADAAERARRALEAANPPLPRRGPLPSEAAARAETCARRLAPELTLLLHGADPLDEKTLRAFLAGEGLTGVVIGPGLSFAAAVGKACVHGSLAGGRPELSVGPPAPDGACHP